ncbi:MAG: flagellar filament capping protein FliD [Geminicoccaceae bacterium]|nr:flagellar filament capping protein FliD [Geminicoccaceae bacterium]
MPTSSAISYGSLSTSTGAPRLSGAASKLDTETIITALYEAKRYPAVRLEKRITENEAKVAAFGELRTLLNDLKGASDGLRNPPGTLGRAANVFEKKQAFLTSATAADPNRLLGLTVDNKALPGRFDIEVNRLAAANKLSTLAVAGADTTLADAWNGGAAFAGSLDVGLDGGTSATIAIDGTMDIHDLGDAINAQTATTGVSASVVKVSDTELRLVLNAKETGRAITIADAGGIGGGFQTSELQAPQTAEFAIDGVTMTRTRNDVSDVIDGLTLNLYQAEPGTKITASVEASLGDVKEKIVDFVNAYNAVRDFMGRHDQPQIDEETGDGLLFGDRTLRDITSGVSKELSRSVAGLSTDAVASLRGIGLKLDAANRLTVDDSVLDNKLLTDLDGVRNVLEFRSTTTSSDLRVAARTNLLADQDFTVDIVDADADGVPESATIDGLNVEIKGQRLVGGKGTPYEGLELVWIGKGSTSIQVKATQGIADRIYNQLDASLSDLNGDLSRGVKDLEDRNRNYEDDITQINERAEKARAQLIEQFSNMEAALSMAETMLNQIKAQTEAWSSSN